MKNRFKEMVDAGVATFKYNKNAEETPVLDSFVRTYNIYWGQPTNTHMTFVDGRYIITGAVFEQDKEFFENGFMWMKWIKGFNVGSSGYGSLSNFLWKNNKDYKTIKYNGSTALEVFERPSAKGDCETGCYDTPCASCSFSNMTCDSKIPESVSFLELKKGIIKEVKDKCDTVGEFVEKLNETKLCRGEFCVMENNVLCMYGDKVYVLLP